jgi:3-oxoadipate enol-lactonase
MSAPASLREYRASNGIFYRIEGEGEPLLLLHGLMVSGAMYDPLIELMRQRFRMLLPDLRGHGRSGSLEGPYDVATLAADLDPVLAEAGFDRFAVMGYSHGGAVAQQLAHTRPAAVRKLILTCTYACSASTLRDRLQATVLIALLRFLGPGAVAKLFIRPWKPKPTGMIGLNKEQAAWLQSLLAANRAKAMRGAASGLISFDARPWLKKIQVPTLVIGGTHDIAVPSHHYDTLLNGIPGAKGCLLGRAGHGLAWTHTRELAEIISTRS